MYTRPLVWLAIYLILGGIHLVFSWDDDTDQQYRHLRPTNRYVFIAGSVVIWLPLLIAKIVKKIRAKWGRADEGEI